MSLKKTTKLTAGAAAAAVALMGMGVGAAAADQIDAKNISSITAGQKGSITITKGTESGNGVAQDGSQALGLPEGSKPVGGITFVAKQVEGIDLTTNAGWAAAQKLITGDGTTANFKLDSQTDPTKITSASGTSYNLGAANQQTTANDGVAKFSDLPLGLYVIYEIQPTGDVTVGGNEKVPGSTVGITAPMVVTVPMTNPADQSTWLYDLNIYPKNQIGTPPVKSVDDNTAGQVTGNTSKDGQQVSHITYTLSAEVPALPQGQQVQFFNLTDTFYKKDITWKNDVWPDQVVIKKKAGGEETLTADQYSFVGPEAAVNTAKGDTQVVMKLSAAVAQTLKAGDTVVWTFNALANAQTAPNTVPNSVDVTYPSPTGEPVTVPGNTVKSYYGAVTINKTDPKGNKLDGAVFNLYQCTKTGEGEFELTGAPLYYQDSQEITVNKTLTITDLLVNDFRNNSEFVNGKDGAKWADTSYYCLKEIKAPKNFELLANPIAFQVLKGDKDVAEVASVDVVNNPPHGGFQLPKTGGAGIVLLVVAGGLLLAGSGAYIVANNRKRNNA